jgi:hypothetical protein
MADHVGWILLVGGTAVPLLSAAWSLAAADRIMPAALREVAALDQERLAHVDRSTPSFLERTAARLLPAQGRLVFEKDASLLRRRYPTTILLWFIAVLALWIGAAVSDGVLSAWMLAVLVGFAAHAVIVGRRIVLPPTEHLRMLAALALSPPTWKLSKRLYVSVRTVLFFAVVGVPLVAMSIEPALVSAVLCAVGLAAVAGACIAVRE